MTDVDAGTRSLEHQIRLLEEQVRFFKSAYGVEEGTPQEIISAAVKLLDGSEPARRVMRHIIAQGQRAEQAEKRATKLHETLLHVSTVVAETLERFGEPGTGIPPKWLLALGYALDMTLAEAALERRPPL